MLVVIKHHWDEPAQTAYVVISNTKDWSSVYQKYEVGERGRTYMVEQKEFSGEAAIEYWERRVKEESVLTPCDI